MYRKRAGYVLFETDIFPQPARASNRLATAPRRGLPLSDTRMKYDHPVLTPADLTASERDEGLRTARGSHGGSRMHRHRVADDTPARPFLRAP